MKKAALALCALFLLGLLGHPGRYDGYGDSLGMYPINNFEQSVTQAIPEYFPEEFVERSLGRIIVQMADSSKREPIDADGDEEWWRLTKEGQLGRFAIMENYELVSPWFDEITSPRRWGRLWENDFYAAQQGDAWQLIDHTGKALLPFSFEHLLLIDDSAAFAKHEGYYGILNYELTMQQ